MMRTIVGMIVIGASLSTPSAHAATGDVRDALRQAKALIGSLIERKIPETEVIAPPEIDPGILLKPPRGGAMPVIEPPAKLRQR